MHTDEFIRHRVFPFRGLEAMMHVFHGKVIALLVEKHLPNEEFTANPRYWKNSGSSIDK
jgi:hypothetical protein